MTYFPHVYQYIENHIQDKKVHISKNLNFNTRSVPTINVELVDCEIKNLSPFRDWAIKITTCGWVTHCWRNFKSETITGLYSLLWNIHVQGSDVINRKEMEWTSSFQNNVFVMFTLPFY